MLHKETVADETLDLIQELMRDPAFSNFNLVGGTALSLQIGHRISEDIDLFSQNAFNSEALANHLSTKYQAESVKTLKNGVFCFVRDVKVDLISHQYPLLKPLIVDEGVRMVSLEDIAAMKLNAITGSGKRLKDFVDIHALLEYHPLKDMLTGYETKYPEVSVEIAKKALNYHDEINEATIHFLDRPISLEQIKKRIYQATISPGKVFKFEQEKTLQKDEKKQLSKGLSEEVKNLLDKETRKGKSNRPKR
jgi:hypothetical protein